MSSTGIRAVSDEEVAHLRDHGWVRLNQLISPDLAAELLEHAKMIMGPEADQNIVRADLDAQTNPWRDHHNVAEEDPSFHSVAFSEAMGKNAQRMMRREIGVLLYTNLLAVKIGIKQAGSAPVSAPTEFHQDGPSMPYDRAGRVTFWIALDHITPEMGLVQFVDKSHHLGSLGNMVRDGYIEGHLHDVYPELREMAITETGDFSPGDATAHGMYTVHSAPANSTDHPRWTFIINYIPSDVIYTGAKTSSQKSLKKLTQAGLVPGQPFADHPDYPRIY